MTKKNRREKALILQRSFPIPHGMVARLAVEEWTVLFSDGYPYLGPHLGAGARGDYSERF